MAVAALWSRQPLHCGGSDALLPQCHHHGSYYRMEKEKEKLVCSKSHIVSGRRRHAFFMGIQDPWRDRVGCP